MQEQPFGRLEKYKVKMDGRQNNLIETEETEQTG